MSPNTTNGGSDDQKLPDGNGGAQPADGDGNDGGNKKPIPLAALISAVSDEKTRYPIPVPAPVSSDDPVKVMRFVMIVVGLGAIIAALALAASAEPFRFVEGAGEVAISALGTLFIVALFVERAQQVYVGAWRGIDRAIVDEKIRRWRDWRMSADHYPNENQLHLDIALGLQQAELDLATFRQTTRRYVFYLGLALGVFIAAAGPRILREVIEPWGDPGDLQE